jgi:hypothetical protein
MEMGEVSRFAGQRGQERTTIKAPHQPGLLTFIYGSGLEIF